MEFDSLFLILLPIIFAAGWFARFFDLKENKYVSAGETQTLYKGLDLLLNNKPDQAIGSLVNLAKIDPDTVELHFSLGSLFRKRGDYARAVKIHNHLSRRADLPKTVRARAMYELGKDYLKAGILDRAENSFRELSDMQTPYKTEAVRQLVDIYESEKDWLKAIDEAHILESISGETFPARISHLFCELSTEALNQKNLDQARKYLENAISADRRNKRALIMLGNMLKSEGDLSGAVSAWRKVGQISPKYQTFTVKPIVDALMEEGKKEDAIRFLESVAETSDNNDEIEIVADLVAKIEGVPKALEIIKRHMKTEMSLVLFLKLMELRLTQTPDDKSLKELYKLMKLQVEKTARYKCTKCGFVTRKFQWQCPGCRNWDSFPPVRSEDPFRK
ncbi:MAG: lipopolysaccharide assembly protein LapB [Burkholderiales bacterium]|nr:lipopolysaccharide assembly protein LapB [Burkholderiales bacterium]